MPDVEWDYQFRTQNLDIMSIGESKGDKVWKKLWSLKVPGRSRYFDGGIAWVDPLLKGFG
jgi:hypothetical protein